MNGARVKASSVISAANGTDDTGEVEEMRQLVRKDYENYQECPK